MGAHESSPRADLEQHCQQEHVVYSNDHIRELYADLTAPDHLGAAVDQKMFRVSS